MLNFNANKILLIATRQIGDALLVTPLLRSIRRAYPNSTIDVLVYDHKGGMLAGNPDLNHLISIAEHPNLKQYQTLWQQIFRRYDLAISTLSGDRPLIYTWLAARQRIAVVPPRYWQATWKRMIVQAWTELDNESTHTVLQNLRLADLLGIERCYDLVIPTATTLAADDVRIPFAWHTQPYVVLHLVPMWKYKRWTIEGWRNLIAYFLEKPWRVLLTGGDQAEEHHYLAQVQLDFPNAVTNIAGQLNFGEIAQLIKTSQLYVGPDTAVTHLAAATGAPTVALYGPTNPLKWSPWPHGYTSNQNPFRRKGTQQVGNVLLIQPVGGCVPCHQEGCGRFKQSNSYCLEELKANTVISLIEKYFSDDDFSKIVTSSS